MNDNNRMLVIGDVMLDVYIKGEARRLSPEAPCPVLDECGEPRESLGGAANVAVQLAASGFDVTLWGCIGTDNAAASFKSLIGHAGIKPRIIEHADCATTVKTRYIAGDNRQLLRVDRDCRYIPTSDNIAALTDILGSNRFVAVVMSDYGKGVLSPQLCRAVINACRNSNTPVIVDIKHAPFDKFAGATILKGNRLEITEIAATLPSCATAADDAARLKLISDSLGCDRVIMTDGSQGIIGYDRSEGHVNSPTADVPVFDVTGAGDVVTAFIAMLTVDSAMSLNDTLRYANIAAQRKVSQAGTAAIALSDIVSGNHNKKKVVFTNGCFDVIHAGHISLLQQARALGDMLVVGINTDRSVRELKGPGRPVNTLDDRIAVLTALKCVDRVIPFDESTPARLIKSIRPDVLVKGADYNVSEIVGSDFVISYGGSVITIPLVEGQSTTRILERMTS